MVTEGEGLPLAFDVAGASVSEVTVGLDTVDRVRVPRARGRPKKRPDSLAADKSYDGAEFRWKQKAHASQRRLARLVKPSIVDGNSLNVATLAVALDKS